MRDVASLRDGPLAAGDAFEKFHARFHGFELLHIHQEGGGFAMFGDENRISGFPKFGEDAGGVPLEVGDEFGFHSDTKVSLLTRYPISPEARSSSKTDKAHPVCSRPS